MKINAITLAAAAAAGLAAVAYVRSRSQAGGTGGAYSVFGTAAQQHDAVQSATPQNIDYLANWQDLTNAWGSDPNAWL